MIYVGLLRGVNVGGQGVVKMSELKTSFEELGLQNVRTYINSGNVIFESEKPAAKLRPQLEDCLDKTFKLPIKVLLRDSANFKNLVSKVPKTWVNDKTMKCDVLFLDDSIDKAATLKLLPTFNPEHEDVRYIAGAVVWRIDRSYQTKSKITRLVGTDLYKQMTARNINTVRKLYTMMQT